LKFSCFFETFCFNSLLSYIHLHTTGCPTKHDSWWIVFNVFFHDTVLVIYDFLQFYFVKQIFSSNTYLLEINFTIILLSFLVSNNLTNHGRRHFKLFTKCHVSWDTLYIRVKQKDRKGRNYPNFKLSIFLSNLIEQ